MPKPRPKVGHPPASLLSELRIRCEQVQVVGGRLVWQARPGRMTTDLVAAVKANEREVAALVAAEEGAN